MLDNELIVKIESFVHKQPRSMDEISKHIGKNWRTADRYVTNIIKDHGTLAVKTFRPGSRGSLKVVFWNNPEKTSKHLFQEELEEEIMLAKTKDGFSQFDIYQYVPENNKSASIEPASNENHTDLIQVADILKNTKKQLLIFSGNISFINFYNKQIQLYGIVEELVKNNVSIKIICRVDLVSKDNVEKILSLNFKHGKKLIEIHHREHSLRCMISDNKIIRMKEVKEPTGKINELDKKVFIFYTIKDKEWAEWMSRIFWKMFNVTVDATHRLKELRSIMK
ncbi:MAG: hypothetical protein ACP5N1_05610 [Candidatus Woesearchaeota archaeon]